MNGKKCKVAILDDHRLFIEGFELLIQKMDDLEMAGVYDSSEKLLNGLKENTPDIIFLDIYLPNIFGWELASQILTTYPQIKIIALTASNDGYDVHKMIKAGAVGYTTKDLSSEILKTILNQIQSNEIYISPEAALNYAFINPVSIDSFSDREIEIIKYIANEKTDKEIAEILGLSEKTIELDKRKICDKMNVKKVAGIVSMAYKLKILK